MIQTKEEYVDHLTDCVATTISGFDRDWVRRQLNAVFGDRVMIETDGYEIEEENGRESLQDSGATVRGSLLPDQSGT